MSMVSTTPIYVISLRDSVDRWRRLQTVLARQQVLATLVPAVAGRSMTQHELLQSGTSLRTTLSLVKPSGRPRCDDWTIDARGAVGCTLSHVDAWQRIIAADAPYAVVLEDDADVRIANLREYLAELQAHRLYGCDVMMLTAPCGVRDKPVAFAGEFQGTTGYCLSQRAARVLVQYAHPIEQHVDHYIANLAQLNLLVIGSMPTAVIGINPRYKSTIRHGATLSDFFYLRKATVACLGILLLIGGGFLYVTKKKRSGAHPYKMYD